MEIGKPPPSRVANVQRRRPPSARQHCHQHCRSLLLLLSTLFVRDVAAWSAADEAAPLPLTRTLKLAAASGTGVALARRASRGPPPPLRSVIGGRAEAALVEEAPPSLLALIIRALHLLLIFLPGLLTAPLAVLPISPIRRVWFWIVRISLARAGTAFIKWGQWAACRPDMFPERLCAELAELHSNAPVHSFGHTRREVEASFNCTLEEIFQTFDKKPLASGSIAQVECMHRTTRLDSTRLDLALTWRDLAAA